MFEGRLISFRNGDVTNKATYNGDFGNFSICPRTAYEILVGNKLNVRYIDLNAILFSLNSF